MKRYTVLLSVLILLTLACGLPAVVGPAGEPEAPPPVEPIDELAIITTSTRAVMVTHTSTLTLTATLTLVPGQTLQTETGADLEERRPAACIPAQAAVQLGIVTFVVDGDTIDVSIDRKTYRVRYIGVDAPENMGADKPVEFLGPEAEAKNRKLVENQVVLLVNDVSEADQNGHLLRYVFVGNLEGVFVNYELVRQGYAAAVAIPPDVACAEIFRQAQEMARYEFAGIWQPTPAMPTLTPTITPTPTPTFTPAAQTFTATP